MVLHIPVRWHVQEETDAQVRLYIDWIIAFVAFFFLRLSVMLFTLRLLPRTKFRSQIIIYVAMFLNFAISLIAAVSYGLHCQPVSAYWHPVQGAKCLNSKLLKDMMIVNGGEHSLPVTCISRV